jgi:two-component system phosphate regulon sensor histidine kinase PhoR
LQAIKRRTSLPVVKQYVTKASVSISKLQSLINDLLDVSKIKAGRLEYAIGNVNITDLVNLCVENARHVNPAYIFNIKLDDEYIVNGNQERLEQVLMNLINNAVKYSPVNKTVTLTTQQIGDNVRVGVADSGIGLSPDQKDKIFERFYRVEDKQNMTSGLGMGLYISKEIINNHNGVICVESEMGKGSTFYFELPLI